MRTQIVFYYFLLDIAYPEFSDTDGELDDCDEDNRVVEGEKKHLRDKTKLSRIKLHDVEIPFLPLLVERKSVF